MAGLPAEQIDADLRIGAGAVQTGTRKGSSRRRYARGTFSCAGEYAAVCRTVAASEPLARVSVAAFLSQLRSCSHFEKRSSVRCWRCSARKDMTIDPDQNATAMKSAFSRATTGRKDQDALGSKLSATEGRYRHGCASIRRFNRLCRRSRWRRSRPGSAKKYSDSYVITRQRTARRLGKNGGYPFEGVDKHNLAAG